MDNIRFTFFETYTSIQYINQPNKSITTNQPPITKPTNLRIQACISNPVNHPLHVV